MLDVSWPQWTWGWTLEHFTWFTLFNQTDIERISTKLRERGNFDTDNWILGLIRNLQWEKGIEERVGNVLTLRMMNWILWTPALIQMLPVVAGMFQNFIKHYFISPFVNCKFIWCWFCCRVVGLKGVQPRAADTTATVNHLLLPQRIFLIYFLLIYH